MNTEKEFLENKVEGSSDGASELLASFGDPQWGSHRQTAMGNKDYGFYRELEKEGYLKRADGGEGDEVIDYALISPHLKFKPCK